MSDVYMGQIMLAGFGFAPKGFALCNGQLMSIAQNQALFSLLGTQYGGDGRTTFALPDLQGRVPMGNGGPAGMGQAGGVESVSLAGNQMPVHAHALIGTSARGGARSPANNLLGVSDGEALYGASSGTQVGMAAQNLAVAGNGTPHENMQPFQVLNFVIALAGLYPSRN